MIPYRYTIWYDPFLTLYSIHFYPEKQKRVFFRATFGGINRATVADNGPITKCTHIHRIHVPYQIRSTGYIRSKPQNRYNFSFGTLNIEYFDPSFQCQVACPRRARSGPGHGSNPNKWKAKQELCQEMLELNLKRYGKNQDNIMQLHKQQLLLLYHSKAEM